MSPMQLAVVNTPPPTLPLPYYLAITLRFSFVTTPFSVRLPSMNPINCFPISDLDRLKLKSMSNVTQVLLAIESVCGSILWRVLSEWSLVAWPVAGMTDRSSVAVEIK